MSDICESCGCPEGVDGHDVLYRQIDELKKAAGTATALNNLAHAIGTMDADERKILCDEIQRLELQVDGLRKALERYAAGCEDCEGDKTVDCYCGYARAALKETPSKKPKSDGWHCPVCNLITDRAGLPCPDCAEKRTEQER